MLLPGQVIVERAAEARENDHAKKVQQKEAERSRSMEDLVLLCAGMDINANGMISYQELLKGYDRVNDFQKLMDVMDITRNDLESIFYVLDEDGSGEVSYLEFCSSLGTFFKREPIIMHSLVRYSVMEIRSFASLVWMLSSVSEARLPRQLPRGAALKTSGGVKPFLTTLMHGLCRGKILRQEVDLQSRVQSSIQRSSYRFVASWARKVFQVFVA